MKRLQFSIYYLQELKYRLAYAALGTILIFCTTYKYKQGLIFIFLPKGLSHFVSTGLTEIFFTYLQLCLTLSFGLSIGIVLIELYLFIRPGLYAYEAELSLSLLIGTILFYLCLYSLVFPTLVKTLWELFSMYSKDFTPIHLTFEPKLNDYLQHLQQLNKTLSLSFPCIFLLNIIQTYTNRRAWVKYRGIAYIIGFTVAALVTPPDILSQMLIGIPFISVYEIQIIFWSLYKEYHKQLLIRQPIKSCKNTYRDKK
uniref:SecY-independent transporter protein n=1 Tax=Akkesiphycus lubricus TaxID=3022 RepID=A0A8F0FBK4_AKKLU|nr:SecY-independent transporter protein [Akkesiphycus lubricus]